MTKQKCALISDTQKRHPQIEPFTGQPGAGSLEILYRLAKDNHFSSDLLTKDQIPDVTSACRCLRAFRRCRSGNKPDNDDVIQFVAERAIRKYNPGSGRSSLLLLTEQQCTSRFCTACR